MTKNDAKHIFISQPMHGKDIEEVKARAAVIFEEAKKVFFKDENVVLIENIEHKDIPENAHRLMHLGESIKAMSDADIVIFDTKWGTARGCIVEVHTCVQYGIMGYVYDPDLGDPEEDPFYPFLHLKGTPKYGC